MSVREARYRAGEVVFAEGDYSTEAYVIKRGRVELKVTGTGAGAVVKRLLALVGGDGRTRQELFEQFAAPDRPAIEALVQHLVNKRLLLEGGPSQAAQAAAPEDGLAVFYWHFGTTDYTWSALQSSQTGYESSGSELKAHHLSNVVTSREDRGPAVAVPVPNGFGGTLKQSREATERANILRALEKSGQSRTRAAQLLGVSRVTLYKKMRRYGLLNKTPPPVTFPFDGYGNLVGNG